MFVRNQHIHERSELTLCEFESQDATKNNVCICRLTHQFLLDDCVISGENIVFVLGSGDHFSLCFSFISQLCDHVIIIITKWCSPSEQMDREGG